MNDVELLTAGFKQSGWNQQGRLMRKSGKAFNAAHAAAYGRPRHLRPHHFINNRCCWLPLSGRGAAPEGCQDA
jgi:hypothetical protein